MLKTAWDFFLSFTIRAIFTAMLFGGVNWLGWCFEAHRTRWWTEDEQNMQWLIFMLAALTTLVGLAGTFRRGKGEAGFSVIALASIAAGAAFGHVHAAHAPGGGRVLRRFPALESYLLGSLLIALWPVIWISHGENWVLRNGAMIGAAQIVWGLTRQHSAEEPALLLTGETPPPS